MSSAQSRIKLFITQSKLKPSNVFSSDKSMYPKIKPQQKSYENDLRNP